MRLLKLTIIISLFLALTLSGPVQAFSTVLTVVETQANVLSSTIPTAAFANGAVATSDGAIPPITFSGGAAGDLISLPDIIFTGGDASTAASATIAIPSGLADNAADHSVTIDGVVIDFGLVIKPDIQLAEDIKNGNFSAKDYTVARPGGTSNVVFTRKSVGSSGNGPLTVEDGQYSASNTTQAVASITITDALYGGNPYDHTITIDGVGIDLGSSAQTTSQIAATIATANFSAKDYTVAANGSTVTFTKNSAGACSDTLPMDGAYTSLGPVAASAEITVPAGILAASLDRALEIDGIIINLGAGDLTADQIAAIIAGTNFSSGTSYLADGAYTPTIHDPVGAPNVVRFTRNATGPAGNVALINQDAAYGAVAQIGTVTFSNITVGETVTITINSIDYSYVIQAGDTAAEVVSGLKTAITNLDVTAFGTDTLILSANVAGIAFTVGDTILDAPPPPPPPPPIIPPTTIKTHHKQKDSKLSGYVKEQNTLLPISGASVRLYTKGGTKKGSTKTNKDGKYSFGNLYSGKYVVKISAIGYVNPNHPERLAISHNLKISGSTNANGYFARQ